MTDRTRDDDDIPGTFVFDHRRSRMGYHLNMFCMSLNEAENRVAFQADPEGYLDGYKLTPEQRTAVLERDWLGMLELGGNIYYTFKIGMMDGFKRVSQEIGHRMTGETFEEFCEMMDNGGRPIEGNRYQHEWDRAQSEAEAGSSDGEVIAGIGTSHVPAVGAAIDHNLVDDPYWAPYFAKIQPARDWMTQAKPDVCLVVYNDHASAFSLELIPTFVLGVADEFEPADEGFGARAVPVAQGHPELAWHLAEQLILNEFDMTLVNKMPIDHGCTVPLSVMYDRPDEWPCKVIPLSVNVIQYPPPTGNRCWNLGKALRLAIESFPGDERVAVFGTGGMSHQLQGRRAGLTNVEFDLAFLDMLVDDPAAAAAMPHTEYLREAGSEGIELVMWLIMRGALNDQVNEVCRAHHVPTSNTSNGLIILEDR